MRGGWWRPGAACHVWACRLPALGGRSPGDWEKHLRACPDCLRESLPALEGKLITANPLHGQRKLARGS